MDDKGCKKGLISIIVPAYNVASYVTKCLESLFAQTYKNIEIIAIDDGSKDDTATIIEKQNDGRLVLVKQGANKGQSVARNEGIKRASGEYMLFIDSDDTVDVDYCERLYGEAVENSADIVMAGMRIIDGPDVKTLENGSFEDKGSYAHRMLSLKHSGPCDKLYKSSFIKGNSLSFFEGRMYEDALWAVQCMHYAKKVSAVNGTYYNYFIYGHSTSHSPERKTKRYDDSLFIAGRIMEFSRQYEAGSQSMSSVARFIRNNVIPSECVGDALYENKISAILKA